MDPFEIKRNDLRPVLIANLVDAEGAIVALTGASLRFHMKKAGATTTKVDAAATITTAASGLVRYTWLSGDTDTHGDYEGEFEVTYSGGDMQTFPVNGYIPISILADLA